MEIKTIEDNRKDYLDLLLLADEQEDMIDRYLQAGDMFALLDGGVKSVCVVLRLDETTVELKNIATCPQYQGRGYGRALVEYLFEHYKGRCAAMLVGTGDSPGILSFYQSCGFVLSHRVKDFFVDNYDHPMFEDGVQLVDMVYLKKDL